MQFINSPEAMAWLADVFKTPGEWGSAIIVGNGVDRLFLSFLAGVDSFCLTTPRFFLYQNLQCKVVYRKGVSERLAARNDTKRHQIDTSASPEPKFTGLGPLVTAGVLHVNNHHIHQLHHKNNIHIPFEIISL